VKDHCKADDFSVPYAEVVGHEQLVREVRLVRGTVVASSNDGVAIVVNEGDGFGLSGLFQSGEVRFRPSSCTPCTDSSRSDGRAGRSARRFTALSACKCGPAGERPDLGTVAAVRRLPSYAHMGVWMTRNLDLMRVGVTRDVRGG
jgi:hypothetical protein